ncbi:MAG: phage terminase small subunit [Anaerocolumna sp.]
MPRARDPSRDKAYEIYKQHNGIIELVEIASQLNLPAGTIRGWKAKDKWEPQLNGTFQKNTERSKRNKGGQPGNKNSVGNDGGGPPGNKKAEKYGFFAKYLPEETKEIFDAISNADPLDLLWHQIQLAYTAIVRAQRIAYVKDQTDKTIEKVGEGFGTVDSEKWEVQQAWDKQSNFMKAQARAQGELRSLIKQYDEMLHYNWDLATEEQKARINLIKAQTDKMSGTDNQSELKRLDEVLGEIKGVI